MLDFIRSNKRFLQFVLLLFIVPSFVIVGAWDMVSPNAGASVVAVVDGREIDRTTWENAHRRSVEQMSAQFGGQIPAELLNNAEARRSTLDQIITRALIEQAAHRSKVGVSDESLKTIIANIPEFQDKGSFSLARAQAFLRERGLTTETFEQGLRSDLSAEIMPRLIAESSIGSRQLARHLSRAETEVRRVRVQAFRPDAFLAKAEATDAEVTQEYQSNAQRYQSPESLDIELLVLGGERPAADIEAFSNLVYEQSDSLAPAAKRFGLSPLTVRGVGREGVAPGALQDADARAAMRNPALLAQLFKPDVLVDRRNTESVEIRAGLFASARVVRHLPASSLPLEAVSADIRKRLQQMKALSAAQEAAKRWASDSSAVARQPILSLARADARSALQSLGVSEQSPQARAVLMAVFSERLRLGAPAQIDLGADGVLSIVLDSVRLASDDSPGARDRVGPAFGLIQELEADFSTRVWLRELEQRYKVERFSKRIEAAES